MYPALVNCTTIDLFNEWPQEALLEVGEKYLANVELGVGDQVFFVSLCKHVSLNQGTNDNLL